MSERGRKVEHDEHLERLAARVGGSFVTLLRRHDARAQLRLASQYEQPKRFPFPVGRALAIDPKAIDFSWVYSCSPPNMRTPEGIEIVSIDGPLEHKSGFWFDSYEDILDRIEGGCTGEAEQVNHAWAHRLEEGYQLIPMTPAKAIVLRWNSPGGEAAGATAAQKRIVELRRQYGIPIYSFADELACSAAYELACGADEIWGNESSVLGSVGVIATAFDRTEQNKMIGFGVELITSGAFKADGHPDRKLDDGIRGRIQQRVDALAEIFFQVVAGARDTNARAVADLQAATFLGYEAVEIGLADGVAEWNEFLRIVTNSVSDGAAPDAEVNDNQGMTDAAIAAA